MRPKKTRIGNFILDNGNIVRVIGIQRGGYHLEDCQFHLNILDRFSPIPLTIEWLLKFGFYEYGHTRLYKMHVKRFKDKPSITINTFGHKSTGKMCLNTFPFTKLKYVHQLQNIHFALTGKDLKLAK